jgi:hypothetical protein
MGQSDDITQEASGPEKAGGTLEPSGPESQANQSQSNARRPAAR